MTTRRITRQRQARAVEVVRIVVGLIWLAGAAFNALWTIRQPAPYAWLEESPVPVYRWFFGAVVGARPALWTAMLVVGEVALGVLTLARGGWAKLGLTGGALFSALLCSLATPYTLMMGPYALLLGWLARKGYARSAVGSLGAPVTRRDQDSDPLAA